MGSANAQRNLACTYAVGEAVSYNPEKATYWYTRAAEQGHSEAQNDIAGMWLDGEAGKVDIEKAIFWYEQCASNDKKVPYARWAAEALSNIYSGNFDTSYLNQER
jgi:TPR repeat protein